MSTAEDSDENVYPSSKASKPQLTHTPPEVIQKENEAEYRPQLNADEILKSQTIGLIGEGGQGKVEKYRLSNGELVARKTLSPGRSKPGRGADLVKDIQNEHLAGIKGIRRNEDGSTQIDMELCDDKNAHVQYVKNPQSSQNKKELFVDVLEDLIALHQNEVAHCDVKPAHIALLEGKEKPETFFKSDIEGGKFDAYFAVVPYDNIYPDVSSTITHFQDCTAERQEVESKIWKSEPDYKEKEAMSEALATCYRERSIDDQKRLQGKILHTIELVTLVKYNILQIKNAHEKAFNKAKFETACTIGTALANFIGTCANKKLHGQKMDQKMDVVKPVAHMGVRCMQIQVEKILRCGIKSKNFTKKLGFKRKLAIAVGGAAITTALNRSYFNDEKPSLVQDVKEITKEMIFSGVEYSANYAANKVITKKLVEKAVEKAAVYGGKGISVGSNITVGAATTSAKSTIMKGAVASSSAGFLIGTAIDSVRILCSNEEDKGAAFKESLKNNATSTIGQIVGSAIGTCIAPGIGTTVGGIIGSVAGSLLSSLF